MIISAESPQNLTIIIVRKNVLAIEMASRCPIIEYSMGSEKSDAHVNFSYFYIQKYNHFFMKFKIFFN